ncbi:hypothetical protein [Cereibacter sediminicola]|uniref:hypothetical protein n=1 Tax=Cereibacter sediminicola TaxID=2584941 RepID=UPI00119CF3D6|nr:hypothetical protein [Cereibacter sediminicola]
MSDEPKISQEKEFSEERASLWKITFAPTIWAVHFVTCYAAAAVFCARFPGAEAQVHLLRWGIALLTLVALAGIVLVGISAWRQWDFLDDYDYAHAGGNSEDRHEFLGHAAFLLAIVAFVGTVYTALPALFSGTCR